MAASPETSPLRAMPERFLNRELSWLEFDARVLALAADADRPLLDRVRFLAIFARNLDEFFQVRVAGLQDQAAAGLGAISPDGSTPGAQMARIRQRVLELTRAAETLFAKELRPALDAAGIRLCDWSDLDRGEREQIAREFEARIFPVLTPLAVDPAHPFPYISDLSLNLAVMVRRRGAGPAFARVKLPQVFPRFLAGRPGRFVPIEQVVAAHLEWLFPGVEVLGQGAFRVTRDGDLELREHESVDLLETVESSLRKRRRASDAVRLEIERRVPEEARALLIEELQIEAAEVYECEGLLDLGDLAELAGLDRSDLRSPAWTPQSVHLVEPGEEAGDVFGRLRRGDVLVHHPYESFEDSVEEFLEAAAADPGVLAIKHTLYRTAGPESGILRALQGAAARGKQVVVVVELKARFDEEANIARARALEQAGVHVVYGVVGLKTHAKLALVVRDEPDGIRRYCHIGTGNYNPETARLYEDLGLLTASPAIGADVADLFNYLTSASGEPTYRKLLVAPQSLRRGLLEEIRREREAPDGHVVVKVNGLSDPDMIDALYDASQHGVEIDLVVRGLCCLRPGIPGLSERIRVRSVLGRFLEHSRIYRFGSPARGFRYWIGSADLMERNLDLRVESLAPVEDPALRARLERTLALCLDPSASVWVLDGEGRWDRRLGPLDVQAALQDDAQRAAAATRARAGAPTTYPTAHGT
jgi:polyphosphate kinase